jgi:putative membrane protein
MTKIPYLEPLALLGLTGLVLVWSGISPHDRTTWWLEVAPVIIGAPILVATWRVFPMTALLYRLLFLHAVILMIGAHYTYAEVPIGFWVQDWFDFSRNHYDRLGHLAQGFIPAILAREILIRCSHLHRGRWLFAVSVAFCLAFSAFYEMIEWWVAVIGQAEAEAFLATQGDVWDTQWDMFLALVGAIASLLLLSRIHDRALARLGVATGAPEAF